MAAEGCPPFAGGPSLPAPSGNERPPARRFYGELVQVAGHAPPQARPGTEGWIVGIEIEPHGVVYSVEFEDGQLVRLSDDELAPPRG